VGVEADFRVVCSKAHGGGRCGYLLMVEEEVSPK
jgi:hypothetical protein